LKRDYSTCLGERAR